MDLLKSLLVLLQGKKTYIIAILTVVLGLLQMVGVHVQGCSVQDPVTLLLGGSGLAALRAGIAKK